MKDPIVGAAQLGSHLIPGDASERMDDYVRQREAEIQASTPNPDRVVTKLDNKGRATHNNIGKADGPDPVRLMGNLTNPIPIAGAMVGGPVSGGMLAGALSGAMQPVTGGSYWKDKALEVAGGAALGGASGVAGKMLGGAISPQLAANAKRLIDAGVDLTPGQAVGGLARTTEEMGKSIPIAGAFVRGAELRTIDSFNRASVNEALKPLGIKVPDNLSGRELIAKGQDELNKAYDQLLPKVTFRADQQFMDDATRLDALVSSLALPPAQKAQWDKILSERFFDRLNSADEMSGQTLKKVESELKRFATNYRSSSDAAQRDAGFLADELREEIRNALERQDLVNAARLKDINTAYAMFTRLDRASIAAPAQEGRFTPAQLLAASKAEDQTVRHRAFARGDALLQNWGEAAQSVIGNKIPDSGTAGRLGTGDLIKGAVVGVYDPKLVAGMAGLPLPYTKAATQGMSAYMRDQAPWREIVRNAVRQAGRIGGAGGAELAPILRKEMGIPDPSPEP